MGGSIRRLLRTRRCCAHRNSEVREKRGKEQHDLRGLVCSRVSRNNTIFHTARLMPVLQYFWARCAVSHAAAGTLPITSRYRVSRRGNCRQGVSMWGSWKEEGLRESHPQHRSQVRGSALCKGGRRLYASASRPRSCLKLGKEIFRGLPLG